MTPKEIELHPGHWKNTGSGANGILNEVTEARKVTKKVFEYLQSWKVPSTYYEDNTSVNQRQNINNLVAHHNKDKDGLIVSIHFNASGGTTDRPIGTEVLYYDQKSLSDKLSKAISCATGGGLLNRGAKQRKDLGVLASTYEPAVLIEVCFVNSTTDAAIYRRDFDKICKAIAKVLAEHIGYAVKESTPIAVPKKEEERLLNDTGRAEARELIVKAAHKGIISMTHVAKVGKYSDIELLSYCMAIKNRTF